MHALIALWYNFADGTKELLLRGDSMKIKNDIEVMINNKKYVMCGYESPEYLERIASHINKRLNQLKAQDQYKHLDPEMKNILLNINLVDDYFKALDQVKQLEEDRNSANDDLFDIKHEVLKKQTDLEELNSQYESLMREYQEAQKTIVELRTKLNS